MILPPVCAFLFYRVVHLHFLTWVLFVSVTQPNCESSVHDCWTPVGLNKKQNVSCHYSVNVNIEFKLN